MKLVKIREYQRVDKYEYTYYLEGFIDEDVMKMYDSQRIYKYVIHDVYLSNDDFNDAFDQFKNEKGITRLSNDLSRIAESIYVYHNRMKNNNSIDKIKEFYGDIDVN